MTSTFLDLLQLFITKSLVMCRVYLFIQLEINLINQKLLFPKSFFGIPKMLIIVLLYTVRIKGFCNKNYSVRFLDLLDIRSSEKFLSLHKEIMDVQHFSFYIILSNYV